MKMSGKSYGGDKKRTIIIKSNSFVFFVGLDNIYAYYSSYRLFVSALRRIARKLRLDFIYPVFYGRWKRCLGDVGLVVLFDNGIDNADKVARYIKNIDSGIKVVFWYWNSISPDGTMINGDYIDEIWTYNRFDAKKYGLKYNSQFYRRISIKTKKNAETDLVFLGTDKGRSSILTELENNAERYGLKCDFIIVKKKGDAILYEDYLRRINDSKCIIDLVSSQRCGLTLRPLEALFYEKKLITNYEDIVNYDFYDKGNIFILGKDDINKLAEFVNSPYKKIDKKIVDFYSYESWLGRIERGESIEP